MRVQAALVHVAVEHPVGRTLLTPVPQVHQQEGEIVKNVAGSNRI